MEIAVSGLEGLETGWRVQAVVWGPNGRPVWKTPFEAEVQPFDPSSQADGPPIVLLDAAVRNPRLWSAESPHLYRVVVSLLRPDGSVAEATTTRFGFRRLEIRDRQFLVNGKPILFKGVNRHDHDDRTGKVISRESMLADATESVCSCYQRFHFTDLGLGLGLQFTYINDAARLGLAIRKV